jgi:hypothetical protein
MDRRSCRDSVLCRGLGVDNDSDVNVMSGNCGEWRSDFSRSLYEAEEEPLSESAVAFRPRNPRVFTSLKSAKNRRIRILRSIIAANFAAFKLIRDRLPLLRVTFGNQRLAFTLTVYCVVRRVRRMQSRFALIRIIAGCPIFDDGIADCLMLTSRHLSWRHLGTHPEIMRCVGGNVTVAQAFISLLKRSSARVWDGAIIDSYVHSGLVTIGRD